ncbi:Vegetative incompatibility protein HET-E-1 OS=Podospora anserina GN=HET-E1 PE=4 SV=1 [Rhizoctonia solani AG-1 IB]|uniref:Vegetative incompatibility protein HET-E-1 n=1 Tax=Thanatephorus cucumeris (strain AG1-IB / isolate 7/3/14) TaxID=1108050 RepID=A0A0B7G303_THACB|nr:Vegetative incompatibility protein HET-E-1 OS=Podospora anserina GN=HET-E1 PE=4 SV=1 [Rhizoctonia solani AG-1 IB]
MPMLHGIFNRSSIPTSALPATDQSLDSGARNAEIGTVLRMVLLTEEPIGVETIATLGGTLDGSRVEYALVPLRSVLHQSSTGLVSTLHASFPDFMFSQERSGPYFCDTVEYSPSLAEKCFKVMKTQLRMNICDLPSSFILDVKIEGLQDRIKANISPTLAYACRYWASHLRKAPRSGKLITVLEEFLVVQLLFWMEVMSLRRDLSTGIEVLYNSKQWLKVTAGRGALRLGTGDHGCRCGELCGATCLDSGVPIDPAYIHLVTPVLCSIKFETTALATWDIGLIVLSLAYSLDGSRVAVGCGDGSVSIRNAYNGTVTVGPLFVASGSGDCTIRVWDVRSGSLVVGPFRGHADCVSSVSFSPDGTRIVSGSYDRTIRVWRAVDGTLLLDPLQGHVGAINSVTFSPDGSLIASASDDNTIRLWYSHDGTPAASPPHPHTKRVRCAVFTPDGSRIVSGSSDCTVRVWRVSDGSAVTGPLQGHTDAVTSVAVSGDGTLVASGSWDYTVRVWRLDDGTPAAGPFYGHTKAISSVVYAPDGTRVISGSYDETMRMWNVRGGLVSTAPSDLPSFKLKCICFSPNGAHIVTESDNNRIQMWSVADGTCQSASVDMRPPSPRPHLSSSGGLYTPQLNKDEQLLLVRTDDGTIVAGPFDGWLRAWMSSGDSAFGMLGFDDGRIEVVEMQSGQSVLYLRSADDHRVDMIVHSLDYSLLASVHDNGKDSQALRIWSTLEPTVSIELPAIPSRTSQQMYALSVIYSQCYIREDGWLADADDNLLLWLPSDMVRLGFSLFASLIITRSGVLQVPKQKLVMGKQWAKCYTYG